MKHLLKSVVLIPLLFFFAAESYGQAIGISYENRSEKPTNGFGLHFETDISPLPVVSLSIRLHGSYFSEEHSFTVASQSYTVTDSSYEFGLALLGGLNLGIVAPYAGVGIGYDFFERDAPAVAGVSLGDGSDNSFFYFGSVGIGISALPFLRPYAEYRYRGVTSSDFMPSENGTFALGVQLRL